MGLPPRRIGVIRIFTLGADVAETKTSGYILDDACTAFSQDIAKLLYLAVKSSIMGIVLVMIFWFIGYILAMPSFSLTGYLISQWFSGTLFILAVHRYRLLGWNDETKRLLRLRFGKRELRFLMFLAILHVTAALALAPPHSYEWTASIPDFVYLFIVGIIPLVVVFLLPRFIFTLPAIAADQQHPILIGYKLGQGRYWNIVALAGSVRFAAFLLEKDCILRIPSVVVQALVVSLMNFGIVAFYAIMLCLIYERHLNSEALTENLQLDSASSAEC